MGNNIKIKVEGLENIEEMYKELQDLREFVKKSTEGKLFAVHYPYYSTLNVQKVSDLVPVITTDSNDKFVIGMKEKFRKLSSALTRIEKELTACQEENAALKEKLNNKPWWKL